MTVRENCWEFSSCGCQPGGENVDVFGVCPAAISVSHDGINHGKNAGRICWAVAGTLCEGEVRGVIAKKFPSCLECAFYKDVEYREERWFVVLPTIRLQC